MAKKSQETRLTILQKALELIYVQGFQATSIDDIIATTRVTKGAFFYHFKNKEEMGLAMIREVLYPGMRMAMVEPLQRGEDPVAEIYAMMKALLLSPVFQVKYGCPAVNLIDELAPLNASFSEALGLLVIQWREAIEQCLLKGKQNGHIRKDVNCSQAGLFIVSGYSGIRNMGKILGKSCYTPYLKSLKAYLYTLQ
ncbi:TetR/AcrR family transcriptional regulator [Chitinophaga sp. CB10]|uniref:TetR/AcrR family transcriptional regulator n=1 Tax=Chitinophaga sp. CB10 TaxID=1891659 RepID=UPI0025BE7205|nr:TetR/AcrR family transcriptional regulator [Chitinophaga sp. CB10]